ncbi:TIGR02677 family protein [Actinomadura sp. ATCC 31491]|uniref:TIGR02677 family protein n=1 Tax=Actinomadura luzonensis TaxID=2805427 RepID=A0ABT0G358_9ACTN|nr:TIGR02677 family protein [Actinomadura luzonensis]MCK2219042.1 TIGR02677 family protein [Actinomadura luzonensis]
MAEPPWAPAELFRFAALERADLHSAILRAFAESAARLEPPLTAAGLHARLPAAGERDLGAALRRLTTWGLLEVVPDPAGFATAEELGRSTSRYALTGRGEAAVAGLRRAATAAASPGAQVTAVLDAIADRLHELDTLLSDPDPARDRRILTAVRELECHLDDLRAAAPRCTATPHPHLAPHPHAGPHPHPGPHPHAGPHLHPDATLAAHQAATLDHLQDLVTGLDRRHHDIAHALDAVARHDVRVLHARALAAAGHPPPAALAADPAGAWLGERAARWEELRSWFAPQDGGEPLVRRLQDAARQAVTALLREAGRLAEAGRRPSSPAADFRALARWFAAAPTEEDAHRLWDAAFGLGPSRHAHLGHADAEHVPAGVPWREAAPVEVSALLRSRGRTERMGRTGRVRDVSALRAERRARAARERAALEAAWSSLTTTPADLDASLPGGRAMRLSQLGELDRDTLARLLDLLGRALAQPRDPAGLRRAATSDGRAEIVLRDPEDGAVTRLRTSEGWLRAPDYLIGLRPAPGHARPGPAADGRAADGRAAVGR